MVWSYDLLTPAEQRLLRRLAIFAGGCTLAAAEAICDGPGDGPGRDDAPRPHRSPSILEGLGSLLDKSLLYLDEGPDGEQRFMLLETVREFGLEQLRATASWKPSPGSTPSTTSIWRRRSGRSCSPTPPRSRRSVAEYHNLHEALRWLFHQG